MEGDVAKALEIVKERRAVYLQKHDESDATRPDTFNRRDALQYVVEAFDIAVHDIEAAFGLPHSEPLILDD